MEIKIFYRDGANYKSNAVFQVTDEQLKKMAEKYGKSLAVGDYIEYDNDLGISQDEFHAAIASVYLPECDHNLIMVEEIRPSKEGEGPSRELKKQMIKGFVVDMLKESHKAMLAQIDKALNCGAIGVDGWDPENNPMIIPKIIATAILQRESTQYDARGTSYEKRIRKEVKNLRYFI